MIVEGVCVGLRMICWFVLGLFVLFWCLGIIIVGLGEVGFVLRCGCLIGVFFME